MTINKSYIPKPIRKLRQSMKNNLLELPFISYIRLTRDFYDDPLIICTSSNKLTSMSVNMNINHVEFATITVEKKDRKKGCATQMILAICNAIKSSEFKNISVYLSDPYNVKFWEKMKKKFPDINWKFDLKISCSNHLKTKNILMQTLNIIK